MFEVEPSIAGPWQPVHPSEAAETLRSLSVTWWIAGGWALDLFLGSRSRPHGDLDIGVLRRDLSKVLSALSSYELFEAKGGMLTALRAGEMPRADVNSLWCRPAGAPSWSLELMLDECDGARWVYRRQRAIHHPLAMVVRHTSDGIPYLAPEIQLLYKAQGSRDRDQVDFDRVAPRLDVDARTWLRAAVALAHPGHRWLTAL